MAAKKKPCAYFQKGRCTFGNRCRFSHDTARNSLTAGNHSSRSAPLKQFETELRPWRVKITSARTFIAEWTVEEVFREAKELLDSGTPDVQHEVIKNLADEDGLRFIKRASRASSTQIRTIAPAVLQVLSHSDVVTSLVLEQQIGTIYNVLYGVNGSDGIAFFRLVSDWLSTLRGISAKETEFQESFAVTLDVFARMIALNQTAAILEGIKELTHTFEEIGSDILSQTQPPTYAALSASQSIREIQTRLGYAKGLAVSEDSVGKITNLLAQFHIQQDLPGRLCRTGARHDNDFEDISMIQILPTAEEIRSSLSEYLPKKDPSTHHRQGVKGLLDRQFRLLREDTVGQLRDSVRDFGVKSTADANVAPRDRLHQRQSLRTNVFQNACITASFFDRKLGLLHLVEFDQPKKYQSQTPRQRRQAWLECRDLAVDACVCMADSDQQVTFFSVAERDPSSADGDDRHHHKPVDKSKLGERETTLYQNSRRAVVVLKLAKLTGSAASDILASQSRRHMTMHTLIEFPGVLLASFSYTLEALQQMSRAGTLPFSDLLAPMTPDTINQAQSQAPRYATRAAFAFKLSQVTHGRDIRFSPQGPFNLAEFSKTSGLDQSQARAFIHALSNQFALVQGPPGTGKSFVGVQLILTLLDNRLQAGLGPILCVCYTNHALDQILEHLVDKGVKQIIRIGGRSKSEALAKVNLAKLAVEMERTQNEKYRMWQAHTRLDEIQEEATSLLGRITNADSLPSIKRHLEARHPVVYFQFFNDAMDEEGFKTVQHDPDKAFLTWLHGGDLRSSGHTASVRTREQTLLEREALHKSWVSEIRGDALDQLQDLCEDFIRNKLDLDVCKGETSLRCLQQAHIIGVTTTGLAKNMNILRKIRSKVLIVEEAGEVMEAHMIPALLPSLEHVIAIGDHQQLRPTISNYELSVENPRGAEYSLDISLFERLIYPKAGLPKLPYATLQKQRRMHPLISGLIRSTIYPNLIDAASVSEYPEITSMRKRVFWFEHQHFESTDEMSKSNDFEVEMTAGVVTHLMKQGTYSPGQVTVLTPYLAQLRKLKRRFASIAEIVIGDKDKAELTAAGLEDEAVSANAHKAVGTQLRISTVDNYQGEESDIIIVSLVRSNEAGKVGFLRTPNRINVLLSRARHGMYIIGNSMVAQAVPMWKQVIEILESHDLIGPAFEIFCPRHPETTIEVTSADDFPRFSPEGGCNLSCDKRLKCGHSCALKCHAQYLHDLVICQVPCPRMKETCSHPCKKVCGVLCDEKCKAPVRGVLLPCGHVAAQLECFKSQAPGTVDCLHKVERKIVRCGHTIKIPCFKDGTDYACTAVCGALLPCGHQCGHPCSQCNTTDEQGHQHTRHADCTKTCERNHTTCSHRCQQKCHGDVPCEPCRQPCDVQCLHSRCSKTCSEPCAPCAETCAWSCEHQGACKLACSVPCSRLPCSERCQKQLSCGHPCPSICGEVCPSQRFCQTCGDEDVLDSVIDYIMLSTYRDHDLSDEAVIIPQCGHVQSVSSFDGHMDMKKFYKLDDESTAIALAGASTPFESDDIKLCPRCRGSLRSINRYSRIVKRGLIDEATKRFVVWANAEFVKFEKQGHKLEIALGKTVEGARFQTYLGNNHDSETITALVLKGHPNTIIENVADLSETHNRYRKNFILRKRLAAFSEKVSHDEQPFRRVWDLCRAQGEEEGESNLAQFEEAADTVLNTRNHLLARSLLLHTDLAILNDFVEIWARSRITSPTMRALSIDTKKARENCLRLQLDSKPREQPRLEVEALLYFAFFAAVELRAPHDSKQVEALRGLALEKLNEASELVQTNASTAILGPKIESARIALTGRFQSVVTDQEMRDVYLAMATEFSGTGHWYRCENGHPFTIGECGMPMQQARCPQCGAPIGGQNHAAVAGVQAARDIERQFGHGR